MKNDFNELCDIIQRLRAPGGCPWDREQTHASLRKHLIEEAYEAAEAIDGGDPLKLADELGDVLLQIVMHAQIGKEEHTFDINTVTDCICKKMIERHPHVFASGGAKTSREVLEVWDKIKREERKQTTLSEELEGVTRALPALMRGEKIAKKAATAKALPPHLKECEAATEEEIGERLFKLCAISAQCDINAEEALEKYIGNFIKKIKNIEENT